MFIWQSLSIESAPDDAWLKQNWTKLREALPPALKERLAGLVGGPEALQKNNQAVRQAVLSVLLEALPPDPSTDLRGWMVAQMREYYEMPQLELDPDGFVYVRYGSAQLVASIYGQPDPEGSDWYPLFHVYSMVARGIPPDRHAQALAAANELNSRWPGLKAIFREDFIVLEAQLPPPMLNAANLRWALGAVGEAADQDDDVLAERLGTKTAYANTEEEFDV